MDDYDVVADALQKHRDRLWDMINRNMSSEYVGLGVMDDIRFYQIEQLDAAIAAHKNKKEWVGLTDEDRNKLHHLIDWTVPLDIKKFADSVEAVLKGKNT